MLVRSSLVIKSLACLVWLVTCFSLLCTNPIVSLVGEICVRDNGGGHSVPVHVKSSLMPKIWKVSFPKDLTIWFHRFLDIGWGGGYGAPKSLSDDIRNTLGATDLSDSLDSFILMCIKVDDHMQEFRSKRNNSLRSMRQAIFVQEFFVQESN